MQIAELLHLRGDPGAAFALIGGGLAGVPHEVIGQQLTSVLEGVQQRDRSVWSGQLEAGVDLDHRQGPAGRGDCVALPDVLLFTGPQCADSGLECLSVDNCRSRRPVD